MKKHLLFLFAALLPLVASAQTKVGINGIWYNLITKGKVAEVTSKSSGKYYGFITIPATVTYEGVNYSVKSIGDWAFSSCESLTAITIPEGVTSIGYGAFYGCSSLTAITIPEGVTSIGRNAFWYCSSLTSITIPEGVTSIGEWAFSDCYKLRDVYCYAESVPSIATNAFDGYSLEYATLHVPASAINSYKATAPWSSFGTIVCLTDEDMSIEQLTNDNSQQTIYDLCGRRVATPTKDGIYIVKVGDKVVKIGM